MHCSDQAFAGRSVSDSYSEDTARQRPGKFLGRFVEFRPQAIALRKLYQGATDSKGSQIFPGFMPGGEEGQGGWPLYITGPAPAKALLFVSDYGYFADMVYDKADWDYKKANLDDALAASDKKFAGVLNSTDTNLKPFQARGGKLIIYHGWSDAVISPLNSINYCESVIQQMGKRDADSFLRLYMVPGMQHCAGGPGPDVFGENGFSINDGSNFTCETPK